MIALLSVAYAHEALEEPIPRYDSDGYYANKSCPCGSGLNDQACSVTSENSDPNRSVDHINTYDAGETITVRLHEVIGHSGRWRIAFDPDGADLADFNANILLDEPDPAGNDGNTGNGDEWEWQVTLPDTPCDNCTLQVIQDMNGDTTTPVADPTGDPSYFQCADLVLLGPPDSGDTGGTTPTTTGGTTTTPPTSTPTTTPGTTPPTGSTTTPGGTTTTDSGYGKGTGGDEAQCSCDAGTPASWAGALAALVALARRRR
jgi:uncharacterized protein (TIGR03382 family)